MKKIVVCFCIAVVILGIPLLASASGVSPDAETPPTREQIRQDLEEEKMAYLNNQNSNRRSVLSDQSEEQSDDRSWVAEIDAKRKAVMEYEAIVEANDALAIGIINRFYNEEFVASDYVDAVIMKKMVDAINSGRLEESDIEILKGYLYERYIGLLETNPLYHEIVAILQ